jgi:hypothetical protein
VQPPLAPEALTRENRLGLLPGRQLVRRHDAITERELRIRAVDAGDARIADERDPALAGHQGTKFLERAKGDVYATRCEHDVVGVASARVRRLEVERVAALVELVEGRLVDG